LDMKKLNNTIEYASFFDLGVNYKPDDVIRKGDLVKVVKPEVFVRCGYPMTVASSREEVDGKYKEALYRFLRELDKIDEAGESENNQVSDMKYKSVRDFEDTIYDSIMTILAERNLKRKRFGGAKRSIYTETNPVIEGKFYKVLEKTTCVTGDYYPSSGWYDYEPAGLAGMQVHVILKLFCFSGMKIEAKNVEKIHGDKNWEICKFICGNCKHSRCSTEMLDNWDYCEEKDCLYRLEHEVLKQKMEVV